MSKQKIRDVSGKVIGEIDENTKSLFETLKDIKKDIKNAYKHIPEIHAINKNFMGPFTKNDERLSLNFKGKRKANVDYFLPTDREDYISFKHDLGYYAPSNTIKAYVDLEMVKGLQKSKSSLDLKGQGYMGIGLSYLRRLVEDIGYSGLYLLASKDAFNGAYGYISRTMNDPTLSTSRALLHSFVYPTILFGGGFLGQPVQHLANGIDKLYSLFGETKQYKEVKEPLNNVMKKYDKYLKSVGSFELEKARDIEQIKKHINKNKILDYTDKFLEGAEKLFTKANLEGRRETFILKKNIDKEKSTKLYKDFYNEFNEYKKKVNEVFKNYQGFEPYEIIPLNEDNLFLVGDPYEKPSDERPYDEIKATIRLLKQLRTTETEENIKNIDIAIENLTKKKELNDETLKVLESKILKPFETPATELEEYKKEKEIEIEKEKEIETPREGLRETSSLPLPVDLDFFKKLQEEETKKALEGEIETPFETPIQLNVPTDADFFKSLQLGGET